MSVLLEALLILAVTGVVAAHVHQVRLDRADEAEAEAWIADLRAIRAKFGEDL